MAVYRYSDMNDDELAESSDVIEAKISLNCTLDKAVGYASVTHADDLAKQKAIRAELSKRRRERESIQK